jgi:hypothetical protein
VALSTIKQPNKQTNKQTNKSKVMRTEENKRLGLLSLFTK